MTFPWEEGQVYSSRKMMAISFHCKHMFFKLQIMDQKVL